MRWCHSAAIAGLSLSALCAGASAQNQVVASLPFLGGQTAGPNGTDYADNTRDLWIVEDFALASDTLLYRFESQGTVFPSPLVVNDITVRVYDALPTTGNVLLQSLPATGQISGDLFSATFGGQLLHAGSYYLVWTVQTNPSQIAIFWAQGGPHAVGGGGPDNAWQWNPGLGWNWATGAIRPVPADLSGNGQTGVNFVLRGMPYCYVNCDLSTLPPVLNVADFSCFVQRFAAGDPYANCDNSTAAPALNIADFTCFLQKFAAGCP